MPFLLAIACSGNAPATAPTQSTSEPTPAGERFAVGKVVAVIDGITIDVEISGEVLRVRYLGVEVPDAVHNSADGPSLAERALEFNRFRVDDRRVELEKGVVDSDDVGHLLRYVYIDGEMVNKTMLESGYAVVAGYPQQFTRRTSFVQAEEGARRDGRGYWQEAEVQVGPGNVHDDVQPGQSPTAAPQFTGGTLPLPPSGATGAVCDFSGIAQPVIKGNVDARTRERAYRVPGDFFYSTTEVDQSAGDRWFCTEAEAVAAGWTKSKY